MALQRAAGAGMQRAYARASSTLNHTQSTLCLRRSQLDTTARTRSLFPLPSSHSSSLSSTCQTVRCACAIVASACRLCEQPAHPSRSCALAQSTLTHPYYTHSRGLAVTTPHHPMSWQLPTQQCNKQQQQQQQQHQHQHQHQHQQRNGWLGSSPEPPRALVESRRNLSSSSSSSAAASGEFKYGSGNGGNTNTNTNSNNNDNYAGRPGAAFDNSNAADSSGRKIVVHKPLYVRAIMRSRASDDLSLKLRTDSNNTEALLQAAIDEDAPLQPHHWHVALFEAARRADAHMAVRIWSLLLRHGTPPDELMHATIIAACGRGHRLGLCEQYWQRLHNSGIRRTALSYDAMILAASCAMRADHAASLFAQAREVDPTYSGGWMHLLRTYAWMSNPFACVAVIEDMTAHGQQLTAVHLTKLLRAMASLGLTTECEQLRDELLQMDDAHEFKVNTWLLRAYAVMGQLDKLQANIHTIDLDKDSSTSNNSRNATATAGTAGAGAGDARVAAVFGDDDDEDEDVTAGAGASAGAGAGAGVRGSKQRPPASNGASPSPSSSSSSATSSVLPSPTGMASLGTRTTSPPFSPLPPSSSSSSSFSSSSFDHRGLSPQQLTLLLQAYAMTGDAQAARAAFDDLALLVQMRQLQAISILHYELLATALAEAGDTVGLSRLISDTTGRKSQIKPSQALLNTYMLAHLRTGNLQQCERVMRWARRSLAYRPSPEVFHGLQALRTLRAAEQEEEEGGMQGEGEAGHMEQEYVESGSSGGNKSSTGNRGSNGTSARADGSIEGADSSVGLPAFQQMLGLNQYSVLWLSSLGRPACERMIEERLAAALTVVIHDHALTMRTLTEMCERQLPVTSIHFEKVMQYRLDNWQHFHHHHRNCRDLYTLMLDTGVALHPRAFGLLTVAALREERWKRDEQTHAEAAMAEDEQRDRSAEGLSDFFLSDAACVATTVAEAERDADAGDTPVHTDSSNVGDGGGGNDDEEEELNSGVEEENATAGAGELLSDRPLDEVEEQVVVDIAGFTTSPTPGTPAGVGAGAIADEFASTYELADVPTSIFLSILIDYGFDEEAWGVIHRSIETHGKTPPQVLKRACLAWSRRSSVEELQRVCDLAEQYSCCTPSMRTFLLTAMIRRDAAASSTPRKHGRGPHHKGGRTTVSGVKEIDRLFEQLRREAPALAYDAMIELGALRGDAGMTQMLLEQAATHTRTTSLTRVHAHMRALAAEGRDSELSRFVKNLSQYGVRPTAQTLRLHRSLMDTILNK